MMLEHYLRPCHGEIVVLVAKVLVFSEREHFEFFVTKENFKIYSIRSASTWHKILLFEKIDGVEVSLIKSNAM